MFHVPLPIITVYNDADKLARMPLPMWPQDLVHKTLKGGRSRILEENQWDVGGGGLATTEVTSRPSKLRKTRRSSSCSSLMSISA